MLTMQDLARDTEQLEQERPPLEAVIAKDVLLRLGRPDGLHRVQVKPVSGGKYRVNVYVRAGPRMINSASPASPRPGSPRPG